ncbi:hypothetical protein V8C34DRAFT_313669 [Trichoderma compactum]
METTHGEGAKPISRNGFLARVKAKIKRRPIASVTAPEKMNATSSHLCANDSTSSNLPQVTTHAADEPPQSSAITVSSNPSPDDSDAVPSISIVLAAGTDDKTSPDCLPRYLEESRLWGKAYDATNPETKKWIDGLLTPNSILKSAEREKHILWKDYVPRVISFIKAIGDIAIQFAPAPSDIIWSALKTLLQMSVAPGEELAAILGCSEKVLSVIRRGKYLEHSLVDVYAKSLDLLAHMGQRLAGGYRHILLAIVNPGETKGLIASLIKCENDLITAAQACEATRSANADEHLSAMLNSLSEPLAQINDRVCDLLEEAEENEILDALESFSHIDFGDQHRIRAESRTPGTGEWLLQHRKFQEWEHVPASTILWLQGTVGMGKSFLASKLSTSPRYSRMMKKSLIKLYRENRKSGLKLGFDACKEQLLESVNLYPQTIIILDGLDECDAESRGKLITILANLVKDAQHPVKFFISSRREQDIVKLLPAGSIIEIDANDNRDDIQKFIETKREEIEERGLGESIPKELKSKIQSTLCKGSDGM